MKTIPLQPVLLPGISMGLALYMGLALGIVLALNGFVWAEAGTNTDDYPHPHRAEAVSHDIHTDTEWPDPSDSSDPLAARPDQAKPANLTNQTDQAPPAPPPPSSSPLPSSPTPSPWAQAGVMLFGGMVGWAVYRYARHRKS